MRGTGDVHDFPALEDQIGENPAVFLTKTGKKDVAISLIKGIETGERARAWRAVELRLASIHDREPRSEILDALEVVEERARFDTVAEREEWLDSIEVERVDESESDEEDEEVVLWRHTDPDCLSLDVERESSRAWLCSGCDKRTNRVEEVDPDSISLEELPDALERTGEVRRAIADGGSREGSA